MPPLLLTTAVLVAPAAAGDLYPLEDADALALRRLESEALALAVKKKGKARLRYARTAVVAHKKRMARLPEDMVAFELAVEREGADSKRTIQALYPVDKVHERALDAGWAKGVILDDLMPGWRDRDDDLNELLAEATSAEKAVPLEEDFRGAEEEITELRNARSLKATQYMTRPGATLRFVVELDDGAGPLDAIPLQDDNRLFTAPTRFQGPEGTITAENGAWVGEGEIRITGLDRDEVTVEHDDTGRVVVTAPGVGATLTGAMYSWGANTLVVQFAEGAHAEADSAVFALYALATAAGRLGAPVLLSEQLKDRARGCSSDIQRYRALASADDRDLSGLLAQTVLLGPAPDFAPDRQRSLLSEPNDPTFGQLSGVLSSFWRCANLDPLWDEHRPDWIEAGQRELAAATNPLLQARKIDPSRWPDVRIVPSLLAQPGTIRAISWGNEVSVFFGPHGRKENDPGAIVEAALVHAARSLLADQPCPSVEAAHASVAARPAVDADLDDWLAQNLGRALTIEAGVLAGGAEPEAAVKQWTDEGFTLVPGALAGLERMSWDVWVTDLCGWDTPADDL